MKTNHVNVFCCCCFSQKNKSVNSNAEFKAKKKYSFWETEEWKNWSLSWVCIVHKLGKVTQIDFHLQFGVDIIVSKLWTVSIKSCCCFCRTELFTVAVTNCFSSSSIMEFCLATRTWSWSFSSFIDFSWSVCLSSISRTLFSRKLNKRLQLGPQETILNWCKQY